MRRQRHSTVGRPRRVTDADISVILAWRRDLVAWNARRRMLPTLRQLAGQLGISRGMVTDVIKRGGEFKRASPEVRAENREYANRQSPNVT